MNEVDLSTDEQKVLAALTSSPNRGRRASEIAQTTGLHVHQVVNALARLKNIAMAQYRVGPKLINYWYTTSLGLKTHAQAVPASGTAEVTV